MVNYECFSTIFKEREKLRQNICVLVDIGDPKVILDQPLLLWRFCYDCILHQCPSVLLSMKLLSELLKTNSRWGMRNPILTFNHISLCAYRGHQLLIL